MVRQVCSQCGQAIPETRYGLRLPPTKLRIIDAIARAGAAGIDADDLFELIYSGEQDVGRSALKAHVWQLNDMLIEAGAGVFIQGTRGGGRRYALRHGEPKVWPGAPLMFGRATPTPIDEIMQRIGDRMRELARERP